MRYDILLAPEAAKTSESSRRMSGPRCRTPWNVNLRHRPTQTSQSRIKRLRGVSRPQYRLRVGEDIRVFYDVRETTVEVLAVVPKSEADRGLKRHGER